MKIKCQYCEKLINNSPRSIGSHNGFWHKEECKELYHSPTTFIIKCFECDQFVANSNNVLARHVRKFHEMNWDEYEVKYKHNGTWPCCECGCNERLTISKGGFPKYLFGHSSRGENNPMYGKKGSNNPNTGKIRTHEMKTKYSKAAKLRWSDPNDKRREIMKSQRYKNIMFDHAVKLMKLGKFGISKNYKQIWKYNPFTKQNEFMHSSYEAIFLDQCIERNEFVTKDHSIKIEYKSYDGSQHLYIPDFLSNNKIIYEIKGLETHIDRLKYEAARMWCADNNFEFVVMNRDAFRGIKS